ncbi:hypothetical protein IF803_39880 [Bradyrhizobium sp. UFLA06-06]
MINKNVLTSGQLREVDSTKGLTVDLADARRTDELLKGLGFTPEISLDGYAELLEVRFVNPTEVTVGTVLDQNVYAIEVGDGRAELWLDEQAYIQSFRFENVAVQFAKGTLTVGDLETNVDEVSEGPSSTQTEQS